MYIELFDKNLLFKTKGEQIQMDYLIMYYLIVTLISAAVCGAISKTISSSRGMDGGFWWGFLLGVIGIIVVALRPKDKA